MAGRKTIHSAVFISCGHPAGIDVTPDVHAASVMEVIVASDPDRHSKVLSLGRAPIAAFDLHQHG